jgi:hypothetical protein
MVKTENAKYKPDMPDVTSSRETKTRFLVTLYQTKGICIIQIELLLGKSGILSRALLECNKDIILNNYG